MKGVAMCRILTFLMILVVLVGCNSRPADGNRPAPMPVPEPRTPIIETPQEGRLVEPIKPVELPSPTNSTGGEFDGIVSRTIDDNTKLPLVIETGDKDLILTNRGRFNLKSWCGDEENPYLHPPGKRRRYQGCDAWTIDRVVPQDRRST